MATAQYRKLRPPSDAVRAQMAEYAKRGSAAARGDIQRLFAGDPCAPLEAFEASLQERNNDILDTVSKLGIPYDDSARFLQLGITAEDDVVAQLSPYTDGSGLAILSDSLAGLCQLYGSHAALLLSRSNGTSPLLRIYEAIRLKRGSWKDYAIVATTLRYFYLHRRNGFETVLNVLDIHDRARRIAEFFTDYAMLFVFSHEAAHHVLAHAPNSHRFTTDYRLAMTDDRHANEDAADRLGMQIALHHAERQFGDVGMAVFGALVAIWSTGHLEQATFVRRGLTHPPPAHRIRTVLSLAPEHLRVRIPYMLAILASAGQEASDFSAPVRPEWWSYAFHQKRGVVLRPAPEDLTRLRLLEAVQCEPATAAEVLKKASIAPADAACVLDLAEGSSVGDVEAALARLGVREALIARLLDPNRPLAFGKLKSSLDECLGQRAGVRDDELDLVSCAVASFMAAPIASAVRRQM